MKKFWKRRRKRSANRPEQFSVIQQRLAQEYQSVELPDPESAADKTDMKTILAELEVLREQFAAQDQAIDEMEFVVPSPPKQPDPEE